MMTKTEKPTGLALMREPFLENSISKLPKPTKKQTESLNAGMGKGDFSLGIRCKICGGWHHKDVVHLDYVGHAALTDRLLECDPAWNWEPLSFTEQGLPMVDQNGGMWIRLTVCEQSRLGYGNADGKKGGDAVKELIGDALRNAAMRFGAALDLWHKGDLHADEEPITEDSKPQSTATQEPPTPQVRKDNMEKALKGSETIAALENLWGGKNFAGAFNELPKHLQDQLTATYEDIKKDGAAQ